MYKALGLHHPFFQPVIRRVLTVLAIAIWGAIEFVLGNTAWALFALGLVVVCVFAFFISTDPQAYGDDDA